jgi:hypothetical protein
VDPYEDPLDVQPPGLVPMQNPTPEQKSDLAGQWRNWMANDNNRAALMQFGVSMMSPMGFGQNPTGHIGQALGSVGELGSRREAEDLKRQDADSKQDLRASQAQLAESRAANAGSGAARQADRLQFQRERLDNDVRNQGTRTRLSALLRYQQARKAHDDNQLLVPAPQRTPFPGPDDWFRQMGLGSMAGGSGAEGDDIAPAGPTGGGATPPQVGEVRRGYRYKGGNPSLETSWEAVK